jgi:hypothetical protein
MVSGDMMLGTLGASLGEIRDAACNALPQGLS